MENQNNLSECNLEELTYTDLQEIEGGVVVMAFTRSCSRNKLYDSRHSYRLRRTQSCSQKLVLGL